MDTLITRTISIPTNGIRLHAQTSGPEEGPLVVLLHGFPEFWWGWHHQINALAKAGFRVVVPDQRGYNLSDRPRPVSAYSIDELAKDITGILDGLGYQQAVIAGHDWGAGVAWHIAARYPERVEKLIIVNVPHTAAFARAIKKPVWSQLIKSWYIFFFQIPYLPERLMSFRKYAPLRRVFINSSRPGAFTDADLDRYTEAWHRPGGLTGGINWYRAAMRQALKPVRSNGIRISAERVRVPTLILWGDRDAFLEPCLADWSLDWVDDGRLVHFPTATHWILHEFAAEVNQLMLDFIVGISSPS